MIKRIGKRLGAAICWWVMGILFSSFPFGLMAATGLALFGSMDGFVFWAGVGVLYGFAIRLSRNE
jgi:hypothetical protein